MQLNDRYRKTVSRLNFDMNYGMLINWEVGSIEKWGGGTQGRGQG